MSMYDVHEMLKGSKCDLTPTEVKEKLLARQQQPKLYHLTWTIVDLHRSSTTELTSDFEAKLSIPEVKLSTRTETLIVEAVNYLVRDPVHARMLSTIEMARKGVINDIWLATTHPPHVLHPSRGDSEVYIIHSIVPFQPRSTRAAEE